METKSAGSETRSGRPSLRCANSAVDHGRSFRWQCTHFAGHLAISKEEVISIFFITWKSNLLKNISKIAEKISKKKKDWLDSRQFVRDEKIEMFKNIC